MLVCTLHVVRQLDHCFPKGGLARPQCRPFSLEGTLAGCPHPPRPPPPPPTRAAGPELEVHRLLMADSGTLLLCSVDGSGNLAKVGGGGGWDGAALAGRHAYTACPPVVERAAAWEHGPRPNFAQPT